ncbi:MAG TPA: hypothetical protein VKY31_09465 [Terriglobia bacterium]|nr:hypothetical protein [Terriglobia bacterium]
MKFRSPEALQERENQWKAFHEWEKSRGAERLSIRERIDWYCSAFAFVRSLPAIRQRIDFEDKTHLVSTLHERLKHIRQRDHHV